ncbi:MAG: hypothetical protein U1E84_01020 [Rhodoferax sp.]
MSDTPHKEARALLAKPLICVDIGEWLPERGDRWGCCSGVTDMEGVGTGLIVQLAFRHSTKTRRKHHQFSVFRQKVGGLERVYQLDVVQFNKTLKNLHDLPHEHMGDQRTPGDAAWSNWSFEEMLQHFCQRTKIEFRPNPTHPESFELKG